MKKRLMIATLSLCAAACLLGSISGAAAWFIERTTVSQQDDLVGESQGAYFARGKGTSDEPFIINRPIHLYNLAWLQYIGYFNDEKAPYYFALDPEDDITTLDMTGWVLPPIGTSLYPFIGNFNGNDETIANLVTENKIGDGHIEKKPTFITASAVDSNGVLKVYQKTGSSHFLSSTVDIVGFFGIVGDYTGMAPVAADYATANKVSDVALDNLTVASSSAASLGGIGVGYMNAAVSGMGISDSSISFANGTNAITSVSNNLSDYSTVGYATQTYRKSVSSYKTSAVVPNRSTSSGTSSEGGHELDWGGSIDFKEIFTRLDNIYDNRAKPYWRGVYSETITNKVSRSIVGEHYTDTIQSSTVDAQTYYDGATSANPQTFDSNLLAFDSSHDKTNSYNPLEGKVAFHELASTSTGYDYQYLFGGKEGLTQFKKNQTTNNFIASKYDDFHIMAGTPEERTRTVTETHDSYTLSVYNYYLVASGGTTITAQRNTSTTKWCVVNDNFQDVSLTSANNSYVFTVVNDKIYYITGTLNNAIYLTDNRENAVRFTYSGSRLRPIINGTQYYLYQSGSSIYIYSDTDSFQYSSSSSVTVTYEEKYTVGFAYLNTNGVSIQQGQDENSATRWVRSERDAGGDSVYTTINGVNYYLNASETGLSVSTSPLVSWSVSDANVYSTIIGGQRRYLLWTEEDGFRMSSDAGTTLTTNTGEDVTETATYSAYNLYYRRNGYNYYYFVASPNGVSSSTSGTDTAIAFTSSTGTPGLMFFLVNGTPYYIYASSANALGVTSDISLASLWTVSDQPGVISTTYNGSTRYLYNNNNSWSLSNSSVTVRFSATAQVSATLPKRETVTSTQRVNNGVDIPETITPLVTSSVTSYAATEKNYGYIVSGSNSVTEEKLMTQSAITANSDYGDIRIAKYPIGNIWNSVTGGSSGDFGSTKSTSYCTGKNLGIIGRSYRSNGYVHITDDFDTGNNGGTLPATKMNYADMGLTKYKDSRGIGNQAEDSGLVKLLKQQTGVYGLHYVKGLVSPANTCVAEKALIDNETISNYEMPRDSIDFKLHDSGFVNFFAHTGYYNSGGPTNNSFFDLYEIERNTAEDKSSSSITSIKKIKTIYGKLDDGFIDLSIPYIYLYDDNTTSDVDYSNASALSSAGYSPIFQMSWITDYSSSSELTKSWQNYSIYYFEIPVNAGEYALGAVSGGEGAYLMYLDLGGNAMRYDFTFFTEYAKVIENAYQYPLGVAIIQNSGSGDSAVKDDVNAANSIGIAILSAETVSFQKEGNIVTCDYQADASEVNFVGVNLIMRKSGQDPPVDITAEGSVVSTTEYFRMTTVAYNITLKRYELTELTKTVVTPSTGNAETTYSGRTSVDGGTTWVNMTTANAASAINALNDGAGILDVSGNDVMVLFAAEVLCNENEELDPVGVEFLLTYTEIVSELVTEKYQDATGYSFTLTNPSSSNPLTVTILDVLKDEQGTIIYVISVNGTTVTIVGQQIVIE